MQVEGEDCAAGQCAQAVPVAEEEFISFFSPLIYGRNLRKIAVAVSGGPDSMALSFCAKRWAEKNGVEVYGFLVDHRLREESAREAELTRQRLVAMGVHAEVLVWDHGQVKTRIHVVARQARYDLLIAACRKHGIDTMLLAHQRDDQAETILMRFAKGSGPEGLAGIDPSNMRDGVCLLRPLLAVPKSRLVVTCNAAGIGFAVDPSNEYSKYARGRLRQIQPLLEREGFSADRLIDLGDRAREAKEALDHAKRMLLRATAWMDSAGTISLNLEQLRSAPVAIAARAFSHCLEAVNREAYPPERASLMPVLAEILSDASMPGCTLNGCMVVKNSTSAIIFRELSAITECVPISSGQTVLWDGRWRITLNSKIDGQNVTVRALGVQQHELTDKLFPTLRHDVPQGRIRATLPSIWSGENVAIIPDLFNINGPAYAVCESKI